MTDGKVTGSIEVARQEGEDAPRKYLVVPDANGGTVLVEENVNVVNGKRTAMGNRNTRGASIYRLSNMREFAPVQVTTSPYTIKSFGLFSV